MLECWRRWRCSLEALDRRPLAAGLLASAAVQGLGAVSGMLAARGLGPHDRGVLAAALLWPQLLILLGGLGTAEALTVHLARTPRPAGPAGGTGPPASPGRAGVRSRPALQPGCRAGLRRGAAVLSAAMLITGAQAVALVLLGAVLARVIGRHLLQGAAALALPALAFIPVYLTTLALMAALSGLHRLTLVNVLRLLISGGYALALGTLLLCRRLTPLTALLAYIGAHLLVGLLAAVACARRPGFGRTGYRAAARPLLSYGLRSQMGTLCAAVCERADQAAVAVLLPPARLGTYLAAVSLTAPLGLAGTAVAATALPVVAAASPGDAQAAVARRYVARTVVLALLLVVPLVLAAPWLVALCFGPAFGDAALPARLLAPGAGVWSVGRVLSAVLRAVGLPGTAARCDVVAALGVVGGLLVLTPRLGLSGAAAAVALGSAAGTAVAARATVRALGHPAPQPSAGGARG